MPELHGIYAVWKRELLVYIREKERVIGSFVSPLLWLFVFGSGMGGSMYAGATGTDGYQAFIFPGILTMSVLFVSMFYGLYIIWDRKLDFLKEVLVAPVSRSSIFLGKVSGGMTDSLIQGLIILVIGAFFIVPISPAQFIGTLLVLALLTFFTTSLGLIIGASLSSQEGFALVMNFVMWPMFFFSGALFPVSQLPAYLKPVSLINPVTYAVDALRTVILGQSLFPFYLDIAVLLAASAIAAVIGILSFGNLQQSK